MSSTAVLIILIIAITVVMVVALLRPTGPVTIHARDITVRQEARVKIE